MSIQEMPISDAGAAVPRQDLSPLPQPPAQVLSFRVPASVAAAPTRARRTRLSAGKRLLFTLAAVACSTFAACVVAEIALRICSLGRNYTNPMGSFFEPDSELGCRGKPNFTGRFRRGDFDALVEHDEHGFRRSETTGEQAPPAADSHDVYVLGDSFVWGYGVGQQDVLTNQMARLLHGRVHNCGLIGAGTLQEWLIFEKYVASRLRPGDTVVLVFFGNDFGDNVGLHQRGGRLYARLVNGRVELVPPPAPSAVRQWKNRLKDCSYLFNLASYCIDRMQDAREEQMLGDRVTRPIPPAAKIAADSADNSPAVIITRHYLEALADACRERKVRFLAVNAPGQAELGEDDVSSTSDLSLPEEIAYRTAFERLARQLGIETADLMTPMRTAKQSGRFARLTFPHDFHWNAAGHTVAAEVLAADVARHAL